MSLHPNYQVQIYMRIYNYIKQKHRVILGVMVTVVGNGYEDPSLNPGRYYLYFT